MEGPTAAAPAGLTVPTTASVGLPNFNRDIPSFCEIRELAIPDPFYTYCANHPHHRPDRDPIPIGPVNVHESSGGRKFWQSSPDNEEVRQHLLGIVREPEEHRDGYPFYSPPPNMMAIRQLVEFGDHRVIEALEGLVQRDEVKEARTDLLKLIENLRKSLSQ